jgi:fibronectin-binding autotransporter adhesin
MFFSSWLRKPNAKPRTSRRATSTFRPRLEVLEGREVPSTLTVTKLADSVKGSLPYEIAQAQSGDTIVFDKKLNGGTIPLRSDGELAINKNLTIQGPGAGLLAIDGGGNHGSRIFDVGSAATVTLSGLTLRNGDGRSSDFAGNDYDGMGGAILNLGRLMMSACTVSGNTATWGGGIHNASGAVTVSGCTLSGNTAPYGGGIYNGIGTATVSSSTLSGNAGEWGGGMYNEGTLTVSGCTLSSNSATSVGGGIYNAGTLTVSGSVFSHNTPDNIYGPYTDGGGNTFN